VPGPVGEQAAMVLMGKHKPSNTPSVDTGDHVVVVRRQDPAQPGRKITETLFAAIRFPGGLNRNHRAQVRACVPADCGNSRSQEIFRKKQTGQTEYRKPASFSAHQSAPADAKKPVAMSVAS